MPNVAGLVTTPQLIGTNEAGDERWIINVRFINGNIIYYHNIEYVVVEPGTAEEAVYFLNVEPTTEKQSIALVDKNLT